MNTTKLICMLTIFLLLVQPSYSLSITGVVPTEKSERLEKAPKNPRAKKPNKKIRKKTIEKAQKPDKKGLALLLMILGILGILAFIAALILGIPNIIFGIRLGLSSPEFIWGMLGFIGGLLAGIGGIFAFKKARKIRPQRPKLEIEKLERKNRNYNLAWAIIISLVLLYAIYLFVIIYKSFFSILLMTFICLIIAAIAALFYWLAFKKQNRKIENYEQKQKKQLLRHFIITGILVLFVGLFAILFIYFWVRLGLLPFDTSMFWAIFIGLGTLTTSIWSFIQFERHLK